MMRLMSYVYSAGEIIPLHPHILWRIESGLVSLQTIVNEKAVTISIAGVGEVIGEALIEVSPSYLVCLTSVKIVILPSCLWEHLLFESG